MSRIIKHFCLITQHRFLVFIYCFRCGIGFRGFMHDLSKYAPSEFFPSCKYYQGFRSPILYERIKNDDYSSIANHHIGRNKHHWEYWVNFYKGHLVIKALPYKICIEYAVDMIVASKVYNKKSFEPKLVLEYFLEREKNYYVHSVTKKYIEYIFTIYVENGIKGLKKKKTKLMYNNMHTGIKLIEKYKIELKTSELMSEENKWNQQ